MKLPNGDRAVVDIAKLRDYCLSLTHPRGKHKARVFLSVFGLSDKDAVELQVALLAAAKNGEASIGDVDVYGVRYTIDFDFERLGRRGKIRSSWIIRSVPDIPKLSTCYVL